MNAMSVMTEQRRVVITGMGVVSPLGSDLRSFWHLLSEGASGVRPLSLFDTSPFSSSLAAEVRDFDPTDFIPVKQARRMGRVSQFAVASALMAIRDADLDLSDEDRAEAAVSFGTSVAGLKEALEAHDSMIRKRYQHTNPFTMTATFPNAVSSEVAIALGVHGQCETYSVGCSSTANAIGRASELIKSGLTDIVVAGGAEAPLHPSIFSAMDAGRVLAPDQEGTIRNLPRPFDRTRCRNRARRRRRLPRAGVVRACATARRSYVCGIGRLAIHLRCLLDGQAAGDRCRAATGYRAGHVHRPMVSGRGGLHQRLRYRGARSGCD